MIDSDQHPQPILQVLGVDTGGTFTDFVLSDAKKPSAPLRIHKVLSTPDAPERAILLGIDALGLTQSVASGRVAIIHGSTVATNAALEGKGVRTAFITNTGFKDLMTIGRQTRRELYNLQPAAVIPPVAAELCFEMPGRVDSSGRLLDPLADKKTDAQLAQLKERLQAADVEAVAITQLFSFLNPEPESKMKAALQDRWFVSASHEVLPESGEYERAIATWLNASLGPKVQHYLRRLLNGVSPSPLAVMQSTGGVMDAEYAGNMPVNMLLSGPAGGLAAAQFLGKQTGFTKLLTFDMGGTSTDVSLIDGSIQLTNEGHIGPWPVAVAQVDMHTIGAGGGSFAYADAGGMLQVGPQSAGANPGPACYGQGGSRATVTDANAVLGRLQAKYFLGGDMALDLVAAEHAMDALATELNLSRQQTAEGIIRIANEHMVRALRVISIERGHHLDEFRLCCFGGAGGLHVCALAEALELKQAIVPNQGGVLSALGMVVAPKSRQLSQAYRTIGTTDTLSPGHQGLSESIDLDQLEQTLAALQQRGINQLLDEGIEQDEIRCELSLDLRYRGQRFYLNLGWKNDLKAVTEDFHQQHQMRYGHRLAMPVELVNLRCQVSAPAAVEQLPPWATNPKGCAPALAKEEVRLTGIEKPVAIYWRPDLIAGQTIHGPALITETVSTTLVATGWRAQVDKWGNLQLSHG